VSAPPHRYGGVTLQSDQFSGAAGFPQTRVFWWVYGEPGRAVLDHVGRAESPCRYAWRAPTVTAIRDGVLYATRLASPQGSRVPVTPQEALGLYRPRARARQAQRPSPAQQWWLFELVQTAESPPAGRVESTGKLLPHYGNGNYGEVYAVLPLTRSGRKSEAYGTK
jgi:hypothetical protein